MQNLKYCLVFNKCFLLLFFSLNSSVILFSQSLLPEIAPKPVQNSEQIKWYTMEEAGKAYQNNPKPMFIDLYTEWKIILDLLQ